MDFNLNILTLNCWGLIAVSRHRRERISAIAAHIASSKYDFVFLQEVWSKNDFEMIRKKTASVLPYSHYFYSGVVGSGVCILSRSCIVDTAQLPFSLNGFAHKVLHGDWFAGKVVGLCKVIHHGMKINLYVTHLHANYDYSHDQYAAHRVAQAFELSQFVRLTSESSDLSILAGDFNTETQDVPYQLILHNVGCSDSFHTAQMPKSRDIECATCGHPDNPYTSQNEISDCPLGKRIDYVMYKCGKGVSVKCLTCETPLGKIPNTSLPYSDHEAVVSQLQVARNSPLGDAISEYGDYNSKARIEALNAGHSILARAMHEMRVNRMCYGFFGLFAFIVIIALFFIPIPFDFVFVYQIVQILSTAVLLFSTWMWLIMHKIEHNALLACSNSIQVLIETLSAEGEHTPVREPNLKSNSFD